MQPLVGMGGTGEHDSVAGEPRSRSRECQSLVESAALERSVPSTFEKAVFSYLHPGAVKNANHLLSFAQLRGPSQARQAWN
jgi:hypothetical protein